MPTYNWGECPSSNSYPMVEFTVSERDKISLIRELRSEFGWGLREAKDAVEQGVIFNDRPEGHTAMMIFMGRATKFYNCGLSNFSIRVRRFVPPTRVEQPIYMKGDLISAPTYL